MTESVDNIILIKARKGLTITAKDSITFKIDMYQATVQIRGRNSQPTINFFPVSSFRYSASSQLPLVSSIHRVLSFHSNSFVLSVRAPSLRYQLSVYSVLATVIE